MAVHGSYDNRAQSTVGRFWSQVEKTDGCWLWTGQTSGKGYGDLSIGRHADVRAHRFAYELANGPIPDGLMVCHHCDTPLCVRPDHLFVGTHADNMADMRRKGRSGVKGQPTLKLRGDQVEWARERHAAGVSTTALAAALGVHRTTVYDLVRRRTWTHL